MARQITQPDYFDTLGSADTVVEFAKVDGVDRYLIEAPTAGLLFRFSGVATPATDPGFAVAPGVARYVEWTSGETLRVWSHTADAPIAIQAIS